MPKPAQYIEDVNMRNASNGVIISYCVRIKNTKSTYDDYSYNRKEEVFDFDDDEGSAEFQEAFDRYKELFIMARNDEKLVKGGDTPMMEEKVMRGY